MSELGPRSHHAADDLAAARKRSEQRHYRARVRAMRAWRKAKPKPAKEPTPRQALPVVETPSGKRSSLAVHPLGQSTLLLSNGGQLLGALPFLTELVLCLEFFPIGRERIAPNLARSNLHPQPGDSSPQLFHTSHLRFQSRFGGLLFSSRLIECRKPY